VVDLKAATGCARLGQITQCACGQVVDHVDMVRFGKQAVDEVRTDETRSPTTTTFMGRRYRED